MSTWNKIFSDSGIYIDSDSGKIGYRNNNDEVIEFVPPTATELTIREDAIRGEIISETIDNMIGVYNLLGKIMDNEIKLTNIDVEHFSINGQPNITVEYYRLKPPSIGTLSNTGGYVDAWSHEDTIEYLKREIDRQFIEERERANIKVEPKKEETLVEFKEISW